MKLHTVYKITQGSLLHSIWKQIPLTLPFLHWRRGWQIWGMNLHLALLKIWGLLFCSIFKDDHWHLDWGRTQKADCASGIWGFWLLPLKLPLLPLNTKFAATEYTLFGCHWIHSGDGGNNTNSREKKLKRNSRNTEMVSSFTENIARGTTDPGYRVYNLRYLSN